MCGVSEVCVCRIDVSIRMNKFYHCTQMRAFKENSHRPHHELNPFSGGGPGGLNLMRSGVWCALQRPAHVPGPLDLRLDRADL